MTLQDRVARWTVKCFGPRIATNKAQRNHRFLEEALELVQSLDCTKQDCLDLVEYVYSRPFGTPAQEVGGVMVTLLALCNANYMGAIDCAEMELARCWENIEKIRAKQASKVHNCGPLPGSITESAK